MLLQESIKLIDFRRNNSSPEMLFLHSRYTELFFYFFPTLETGSPVQERKRPRKLSHKVLDCTIEEVSVAHTKKKVCGDSFDNYST